MNEQLVDDVRQTVAEVFFVDVDEVTAESSPDSIKAWDSLAHLNLILALEQRFGCTFDPDQIPELVTVEAIAAAVGSLGD